MNPLVEAFFRELDDRCSEQDTRHSPESKANLRAMRPWLKSVAALEPDKFAQNLKELLPKYLGESGSFHAE